MGTSLLRDSAPPRLTFNLWEEKTMTKTAPRELREAGGIRIVRPVLPSLEELEPGLRRILETGMATKGDNLRAFEEAVAEHLQVRHAVGVSSCTTGLMLAYKASGLTGEVIVPSFTFMATVSSLVWAGLTPVFADVDYHTATIDLASVESAITERTSAVIAVHTFGNPARMRELEALSRKHSLKLLFDAAHGFGTLYEGAPIGSQGTAQSFSLSPTKLVIAGEGGMVTTEDDDVAEQIRIGREYGNNGGYDSAFAGMNARMSEFNALMGLHSLMRLEEAAARRNEIAERFERELGRVPGIGFQRVDPKDRNSYKDFSITVDPDAFGSSRGDLAEFLGRRGIDTRAYYDPPVHRQSAYRHFAGGVPLPNTELLAQRSLSLPVWSRMDDEVVEYIIAAVEDAHDANLRASA